MPFDRIAEILPWVSTFIQSDSDHQLAKSRRFLAGSVLFCTENIQHIALRQLYARVSSTEQRDEKREQ